MKPIQVSAQVALPPDAAWDFMFSDELRRLVSASKMIDGVEEYVLRPDGTPRYTMVMKGGPIRVRSVSDYTVYERPRRTVNRVIGGLFDGGTCFIDFRPNHEGTGTRVEMSVELDPPKRSARIALTLLRPLLSAALRADLQAWARTAKPATADAR